MAIRYICITVLAVLCFSANAQIISQSTATDESIFINNDSTVTVLKWFEILESNGISLSYNTTNINLSDKVRLKKKSYSVKEFLSQVLYSYEYEANYISRYKILLKIKGRKKIRLQGYVKEKGSEIPLEGCFVKLVTPSGEVLSSLSDATGLFSIEVTCGHCKIYTKYVGYEPYTQDLLIYRNSAVDIKMSQIIIPLAGVSISSSPFIDDLNYKGSFGLLSMNDNDPFAQLNKLPGISGSSVAGNLHVNGGYSDENLILLDGVSIFHSHHNNTLVSQFNGDAVKKISFFDSFIPARYEGRLSSVTDVTIKGGDSIQHHQTIGIDIPSMALTLDGPILKRRLTYMISARHSWIDFMKDLFSNHAAASRTFQDLTGKVELKASDKIKLVGMVYSSIDHYNDTIGSIKPQKVLGWKNNLYSLAVHASLPKEIYNTNILSFTEYDNRIFAPILNIGVPIFIKEGVKRLCFKSRFSKQLDEYAHLSWGGSFAREEYNLLAAKENVENNLHHIIQLSSFLNARIRITDHLLGSAAFNMVSYLPERNENFFSIQPRFSLKILPDNQNQITFDFSRMEQFYHNICLGDIPLPTDLRMPSIKGFKPSSSLHGEIGWKHIEGHWRIDLSSFYKRHYDILGVRLSQFSGLEGWDRLIMKGNASSYGFKFHAMAQWNRWMMDLSYTYSRSFEWFKEYDKGEHHPALHDIPHIFHLVSTYRMNQKTHLTFGGYIKSGQLENVFNDDMDSSVMIKERIRKGMNYKFDANLSSSTLICKNKLFISYKIGLYNIIGRPIENEVIDLYSVPSSRHCLPYFSFKLKL